MKKQVNTNVTAGSDIGFRYIKVGQPGIVEQLAEKYRKPLARAQRELKRNRVKQQYDLAASADLNLFLKWAHRVGKGWYGFDLGCIPLVWTNMLHDFLVWLETACPDFEIHQVKMKGCGMRIYLGTKTEFMIPDESIRSEIQQLQNILRFPALPETPATVRVVRRKHKNPISPAKSKTI